MSKCLKESLNGCAFEDDGAVIMDINEGIEERDQHFFHEGIKA